MAGFATQKSSTPCFLVLVCLACWGGRVEFVGKHGVSEGEGCVLCMRCLCVGGREGSLLMCALLGVMCVLLAGLCFPLSLLLVFCCFVSRNAVFEVLFCARWSKPARVFWRKCQTCMYEGVCERRAHSSCFLVVMWGQRSFVCLVHLSVHLHEKSWRCVERGNQRAHFW